MFSLQKIVSSTQSDHGHGVTPFSRLQYLPDNETTINYAIQLVCPEVNKEVSALCGLSNPSILRKTTKADLSSFSWQAFQQELVLRAPLMLKILQAIVFNPRQERNKQKIVTSTHPGMLSAGAKLLSVHTQDMSAMKKISSIIFKKVGLKKMGFMCLSHILDCLSYPATNSTVDSFSEGFDSNLHEWKASMFDGEGPGFVFVSDNVDWEIKPRHITKSRQTKSVHKTNVVAVKCRVNNCLLPESIPTKDIAEMQLDKFLPSTSDNATFEQYLCPIVAQIWAKHIPSLKFLAELFPDHTPHEHEEEMRSKSEVVHLGCYDTDQKRTDEVQKLLQELHENYVPGHSSEVDCQPFKVIAFADYLGFERQKAAQEEVQNASSPSERLEGFISAISDFHAQAEWHKVMWHYLFDTKSGADVGTLYHARNEINARNVTKDPHDNFFAASDLLQKYGEAYFVAGGLNYFEMDGPESNVPSVFTEASARNRDNARNAVITFIRQEVLNPPQSLAQSTSFSCRYCHKIYKNKSALLKHESSHRKDLQADSSLHKCCVCGKGYARLQYLDVHMAKIHPEAEEPKSDHVYNYSRLSLTLSALKFALDNGIKFGNGPQVILCYKYMYLYCKEAGFHKYALGLLESVAQVNALLSPRVAHDVLWNRFVNTKGKPGGNIPIDLFLEHCNRPLKLDVSTYRGELTNKTLQRLSKCTNFTEAIVRQFDTETNVHKSSGKHTVVDNSKDVLALIKVLHEKKVFQEVFGRSHRQFPQIAADPLNALNFRDLQKWLKKCVSSFKGRHCYKL